MGELRMGEGMMTDDDDEGGAGINNTTQKTPRPAAPARPGRRHGCPCPKVEVVVQGCIVCNVA